MTSQGASDLLTQIVIGWQTPQWRHPSEYSEILEEHTSKLSKIWNRTETTRCHSLSEQGMLRLVEFHIDRDRFTGKT